MRENIGRWIDWKITFGNIITIAVLLIGGIIGFQKLAVRVETLTEELHEHKVQQESDNAFFVRKDVQDTRNRFVDEKLDRIERKLDILISR